jgi:hypothetical protein
MLNLSAALLLVAAVFPTLALAQDLSADLSGATARQEGFASLVGQGNAVRLTALTNGIGTPTRAVIRRGGADVVELDAEFNFGLATGTTSGGPVAAILADPASYQLRVEGPDGVIEGPIVGVASAAGVIVDPLRRNFGNVPVAPDLRHQHRRPALPRHPGGHLRAQPRPVPDPRRRVLRHEPGAEPEVHRHIPLRARRRRPPEGSSGGALERPRSPRDPRATAGRRRLDNRQGDPSGVGARGSAARPFLVLVIA